MSDWVDVVERLDYWAEHDDTASIQDLVDTLQDAADEIERTQRLLERVRTDERARIVAALVEGDDRGFMALFVARRLSEVSDG